MGSVATWNVATIVGEQQRSAPQGERFFATSAFLYRPTGIEVIQRLQHGTHIHRQVFAEAKNVVDLGAAVGAKGRSRHSRLFQQGKYLAVEVLVIQLLGAF
jgi:hypothetical protein